MTKTAGFFAGVFAALVVTVLSAILREWGTEMNLEMALGAALTGGINTGTWFLGLLLHLSLGGLFGVGYAILLSRPQRELSVSGGVGIGAMHALMTGVLLVLVPLVHPAMPELIEEPGLFMARIGFGGPIVWVGLHLVYGGIVGWIGANEEPDDQG